VDAGAGYDGLRLAHVLADLSITVPVRMRSDRVLRRPAPAPGAGGTSASAGVTSRMAVRQREDRRNQVLSAPPQR